MNKLYDSEKINNLPSELVDSEICMECGRCCYFRTVHKDVLQYFDDDTPSKIKLKHGEEVPIKLIEDVDGIFVGCGNLEDRKCTIWNDRPKVCAEYNCFESANHGSIQSWIDLGFTAYLIKQIKGIDVDVSNVKINEKINYN
tara:strand:+ start:162 stop:587 length:426 start_codon:yes stop_codon:yes gene_type:complete